MSKGKKRGQHPPYYSQGAPAGAVYPTFPTPTAASGGDDKVKLDDFKALIVWMKQWFEDFEAWGQDVRDDIIRVEGQAGFAIGDPGDPPGGPPE